MGVGSEDEVDESARRSGETRVEIITGDVMGAMSSGEVVESSSGVGDDGGDNDKKEARSNGVGR